MTEELSKDDPIMINFILAIGYFFIFFPQFPNSFFSYMGYLLAIFHSISAIMLMRTDIEK